MRLDEYLRNDEKRGQHGLLFLEKFLQIRRLTRGVQTDFRFEAAADGFRGASLLERYEHGRANLREPCPLFSSVPGDSASKRIGLREQRHVDAFGLTLRL